MRVVTSDATQGGKPALLLYKSAKDVGKKPLLSLNIADHAMFIRFGRSADVPLGVSSEILPVQP